MKRAIVVLMFGASSSLVGCVRTTPGGDAGAPDTGVDAFTPGTDANVDAYVSPGTDANVDAYVPPGTDGGVDAGTPTYTVIGTIGSVGSATPSASGYSVVDDGFETGGIVCGTGTPVYCVIGGIVP